MGEMSETTAAEQARRAALRVTRRLPDALRRAIAGAPPTIDRGDSLEMDMHWLLWLQSTLRAAAPLTDVEAARRRLRASVRMTEATLLEVERVEETGENGSEEE